MAKIENTKLILVKKTLKQRVGILEGLVAKIDKLVKVQELLPDIADSEIIQLQTEIVDQFESDQEISQILNGGQ